ncbi:MAG: FAD-dependent oxidoreductase [Lysinibacillus sp.]
MTQSLWITTAKPLTLPTLTSSLKCDVCIIGGGLTGIFTAYTLAKAGIDVVLLEANAHISHGASGHSTGKCTAQQGILYSKLMEKFTLDEVKLYYQLNQQAVDDSLQLLEGEAIRKANSILYSKTELGKEQIIDEWSAYHALTITSELTEETELPFSVKKALIMPHQAQLNPVLASDNIAKKALAAGARLYTNTRVLNLDIQKKELHTNTDVAVQFEKVILCTHYPIEAIKGLQILKLSNSRSYLVASKIKNELDGQYLSVDFPTRSIRTATIQDEQYLLMAGSQHIAGQTEDTKPYYEALQQDFNEYFKLQSPLYQWSAQDVETPDYLPYVGSITPSLPYVFIATGYRKWGISNSFVAGRLLCSLITNDAQMKNAEALYSPSRTSFGDKLLQVMKVGSFISKEFITGYVTRKEAPTCTHLGCKTRWNEADETWDCPCHGSRFFANGQVLEGPAVQPLKLD